MAVVCLAITSCDEGLAPPPPIIPATISGRIIYISGTKDWPPSDSVKDIRIVAFKVYPPQNIFTEITNGNAYFSESLPMFIDSTDFTLSITKPPVEIKYIVVAQQYGNLFEWRAIGVWTLSGDMSKPSSLSIKQGDKYENININVDFKNLPPQPFN